MNIYNLPQDMQEEVNKLTREHTVNIETTYEYYMMGGYKHAEYLCGLRDIGVPDWLVRLENDAIWNKKNKETMKELEGFLKSRF